MYYPKKEYDLLGFEKSKNLKKKYDAIIVNKKSGKIYRIPFGASDYEHFRDRTSLGLWSEYDHNDPVRRSLFRARHKKTYDPESYSPTYFSWRYLW